MFLKVLSLEILCMLLMLPADISEDWGKRETFPT